ncbi:MAG TPA: acyloxyacyl hydrolase [Candidatus Didemnitutus sp.]|jgi:hypothetical protein
MPNHFLRVARLFVRSGTPVPSALRVSASRFFSTVAVRAAALLIVLGANSVRADDVAKSDVVVATDATVPDQPWMRSAINIESGLLWEIGTGTIIPYRLVPTMLSWRSRKFFELTLADGSHLVLRHRLTLIGTWFEHGPEHHYAAFAGSPSLEWWDRTGKWSLYGGAGGGFGVLDSKGVKNGYGVKGAQGQDFTLNWFMRGGIEHITSKQAHLFLGIMYQHMSNAEMTQPNPGIDALGFTLGYGWKY